MYTHITIAIQILNCIQHIYVYIHDRLARINFSRMRAERIVRTTKRKNNDNGNMRDRCISCAIIYNTLVMIY